MGPTGATGPAGASAASTSLWRDAPRAGVAALTLDLERSGADSIPDLVRERVVRYDAGDHDGFPVPIGQTQGLRTIAGLHMSVPVAWLDPLGWGEGADDLRLGSNADFLAFFGEGWDEGSLSPWGRGRSDVGWLWVSHETLSGTSPAVGRAPSGQQKTLASLLAYLGAYPIDVTVAAQWTSTFVEAAITRHKQQIGGSWIRLVLDEATLEWSRDRGATSRRFDSTSNTRLRVLGFDGPRADHDDNGVALGTDVIVGTGSNCSGGVSPWGTVVSGEENVQDNWGDIEPWWTGDNAFIAGQGFDPGQRITFTRTPSSGSAFGRSTRSGTKHDRDLQGFLTELDPRRPSTEYLDQVDDGRGHAKWAFMGHARYENVTFVTDADGQLVDGEPIVMYGGDDRLGGRVYKWVTSAPYVAGMSQADIRAMLPDGTLYVAHMIDLSRATGVTLTSGQLPTRAVPGSGRWVELSLASEDIAPNAPALGAGTTVGQALQDAQWNTVGAFGSDDDVRHALQSAGHKLGVSELDRPEDVEWNARDPFGTPRLYIALTKHSGQVALDQSGVRYASATHASQSPRRQDVTGRIWTLEEADALHPGQSHTFHYYQVWGGSVGQGALDVTNPDNLLIDARGGVWFATDGNFGVNHASEGLYYLDLGPSGTDPGRAFRVVTMPADAEATGPAFTPNERTLFISVQNPGTSVTNHWPGVEVGK